MKRWIYCMGLLAGLVTGASEVSAVEVLKSMGRNSEGQLGTGILPSRIIASGVAGVATGSSHTLFVRDDGELWGMGSNYYGELGSISNQGTKVPVLLGGDVARVAAGTYHSMYLKRDGTLWETTRYGPGGVSFSQIAAGVSTLSEGAGHSVWVDGAGVMWGTGTNYYGELGEGYNSLAFHTIPVRVGDGVREVAAGYYNTFYILDDGSLWVMGDSYGSQRRKLAEDVVAVAAGDAHGLFVKSDGSLWTIGRNYEGQLGTGDNTARSSPVRIAEGVVSVEAGQSNSFFIRADGTLWGMGGNTVGSLGDGTNDPVNVPVKIANQVRGVSAGTATSFFVKADGSLWAMGADDYGQMGDSTARGSSVPLPVAAEASGISAGLYCSGFTKDGDWWSAGFEGIVGDGARPYPVRAAADVRATTGDFRHRLILKKDKTLWAQGEGAYGKLGDGTTNNRPQPVKVAVDVVRIGVGNNYSAFVKENGDAYGMGYLVWGLNVQPQPLKFASGVAEIIPGQSHLLYLTTSGVLFGFGDNTYGQLGTGFTSGPYAIESSYNAKKAATGRYHTLILEKDGSLWVTGRNHRGQLGDGLGANRHLPHKLVAGGVVDVAAGFDHSLFLKSDGTLWGMGANDKGQLGIGGAADQSLPVMIADHVTSIAAGGTHSLFTQSRTPADMFRDWTALRWLSGEDALPSATPAGDATPNLLRYAFNIALDERPSGLAPGAGDSGMPRVGLVAGESTSPSFFRFEYVRRRNSGLVYTPRLSTTLLPGSFTPMTGTPQVTPIDHQWERVMIQEPCDPSTTPKLFGRVDVGLPAD
ncbi:MAG: hypothetical protein KF712_05315 [Akkermansiaceae bacterium]|nr:hypothetical protein [Akkermansiaceae bacterium]